MTETKEKKSSRKGWIYGIGAAIIIGGAITYDLLVPNKNFKEQVTGDINQIISVFYTPADSIQNSRINSLENEVDSLKNQVTNLNNYLNACQPCNDSIPFISSNDSVDYSVFIPIIDSTGYEAPGSKVNSGYNSNKKKINNDTTINIPTSIESTIVDDSNKDTLNVADTVFIDESNYTKSGNDSTYNEPAPKLDLVVDPCQIKPTTTVYIRDGTTGKSFKANYIGDKKY